MFLSDGFRRRPFDNGFNFAFVVEPFHVVALQQSDQLSEGHQVVEHYNFVLPAGAFLFGLDPSVQSQDALGQLLLEGRQGFQVLLDRCQVFGVLGHILLDDLCDLVVVGSRPVVRAVPAVDASESVDLLQFFKDQSSHHLLQRNQLFVEVLAESVPHSDN